MNIIGWILKLFEKPEVKVGQRWQWSECYDEEINPFDPMSGKHFIITILELKDGWAKYVYGDGSVGSDRLYKIYSGWILLKDGEKE